MPRQFQMDHWPDLILEINTLAHTGSRVRFAFRGISQGVQAHDFGFVDIIEPTIYTRNLVAEINRWADPKKSDDVQAIPTHLTGIGVDLFRNLIPPSLKEYYWSDLHLQEGKSVLLIPNGLASDIPWEIVKPERSDVSETMFWCEQLAMSRWVSDQTLVTLIPGTPSVCVLGDQRLCNVSYPVEQALDVPRDQLIETWPDLLRVLTSEGVGLLNWTGHGFANPDNPSLNSLPIGGETFRPLDILPVKQRSFAQTGPWIFLHACSSAQTGQTFVGLGGWPMDLIQAGVGAVLATAWDVNTTTATRFAEVIYPLLLEGFPVAEAVRQARKVAQVENDPSWLAYQLYAYPVAHIRRDQTQCIRTDWTIRRMVQHVFADKATEDMSWRQPYLEWIVNHPRYADRRLIPLAGEAECQEPLTYTTVYVEGDQQDSKAVVQEFKDIEQALNQYRAIVLLGDSGAGKTTALYRLLSSLARRSWDGEYGVPTPIYISLDRYQFPDSPLEYVRAQCPNENLRKRLEIELLAGRVCLLCDSLNDMPDQDYLSKVRAWREFITTYANNKLVFACRTGEYHGELHIQPLEIRPLDDERILRYLFNVLESKADDMWESLQVSDLLNIARRPLFLEWIIQAYVASGNHLPKNQGMLLKRIVDGLVQRERERGGLGNTEFDSLIDILAEFAYRIQPRTEKKFLSRAQVQEEILPEPLLKTAISMGVLQEVKGEIHFSTAQVREYFAALALQARFEQGKDMSSHWRPPRWQQIPADSGIAKKRAALPPPPTTGWEEPTILAAGLVKEKEQFIQNLLSVNPWLAGQCLIGTLNQVSDRIVNQVRQTLLKEMNNARVPLALRNAKGHVLGQIRDPRFEVSVDSAGVDYIPPVLVRVPTGIVRLGSNERDALAFADERPRHRVTVSEFRIGRYPVTNAEFEYFMKAGGYDLRDYWTTIGWRWRQSPDNGEGSLSRTLRNLAYHREHLYDLERWFREANTPPEERELWYTLVKLDQQEARDVLLDLGYGRLRTHKRPAYWDDSRHNGENQPVVGVTWYEAMAYCAWLTEVLGKSVSLPTEVQWERAAKGDRKWIYPWGNTWKSDRCNALPERVLRPTPVGIFPRGRSPVGCDDMVGNVFEWTRSLYRAYPYDASDGREEIDAEGVRVNRGGGWDSTPRVARCALRGDMCEPETYDHNLGFRVIFD